MHSVWTNALVRTTWSRPGRRSSALEGPFWGEQVGPKKGYFQLDFCVDGSPFFYAPLKPFNNVEAVPALRRLQTLAKWHKVYRRMVTFSADAVEKAKENLDEVEE